MGIFERWYVTGVVVVYSLLPLGQTVSVYRSTTVDDSLPLSPKLNIVHPQQFIQHLADPINWCNEKREIALFFTGCLAAAAPFLLFRLKRHGFSNCRAVVEKDGVSLLANR